MTSCREQTTGPSSVRECNCSIFSRWQHRHWLILICWADKGDAGSLMDATENNREWVTLIETKDNKRGHLAHLYRTTPHHHEHHHQWWTHRWSSMMDHNLSSFSRWRRCHWPGPLRDWTGLGLMIEAIENNQMWADVSLTNKWEQKTLQPRSVVPVSD